MSGLQNQHWQHVARVEIESLTLQVVCRFLYDWMHFMGKVQKMLDSAKFTNGDVAAEEHGKQPQRYRPIVEVQAQQHYVDVLNDMTS